MMGAESTVQVESIEGYNALRMRWDSKPVARDVRSAFGHIMDVLGKVDKPVNIIVDIQSDPQFPLGATITGGSRAHIHRQMGYWLVIGENHLAKVIANTMARVAQRKILWFSTEGEAMAHLESFERL